MWACLALMALDESELNTAETAFAAILEIDRLHFVLHLKDIPSVEGRNAELALYKHQPDVAERTLVQVITHQWKRVVQHLGATRSQNSP